MKKMIFCFALLAVLFPASASADNYIRGDVDHNGRVNIADVSGLIDYLLSGTWGYDEHEYVDLGLPSGTLWATMNIGALAPYDFGNYFLWGEVETKALFNWTTYKWCDGTDETLTKYCTDASYGSVDNKSELEPEDDAAYVNWGPSWRMPTSEQFQELIDYCTWESVSNHGVNGNWITGPSGNTIFLPCAGYRTDASYIGTGDYGIYWSRTLSNSNRPDLARSLHIMKFGVSAVQCVSDYRAYGATVRPVLMQQQ